jgi:hypothetical protein
MLSAEQIQDLRFAWHGAVGGVASIARFRTDQSGIERIRLATQRHEVYKPDIDVTSEEPRVPSSELRQRFQMATPGDELPPWFDFPFDKCLPVYINRGNAHDGAPAYSREYYVDKETGTVYFLMIKG